MRRHFIRLNETFHTPATYPSRPKSISIYRKKAYNPPAVFTHSTATGPNTAYKTMALPHCGSPHGKQLKAPFLKNRHKKRAVFLTRTALNRI